MPVGDNLEYGALSKACSASMSSEELLKLFGENLYFKMIKTLG